MSVSPRLSSKFHEVLGPEGAEDMVSWMDEVRSHHAELRAGVHADFAAFRQDVRAEFAQQREQLGNQIHAIENQVHAVETRQAEQHAELIRWSFVFWVSAVFSVALLAKVLP